MYSTAVTSSDPAGSDFTAKSRIRNAALDLYAANGEDGTSMRAIAAAAGVTVGLLVHHFGTKDGIRDSVEELIVDYFTRAIASAAEDGTAAEVAASRNAAVELMLREHPAVVNYMRRDILDPGTNGHLLQRLTELSQREIAKLRSAGLASTRRHENSQVIELMVRQVGQLFLQPMIDTMWDQLAGIATGGDKPALSVTVTEPSR